MSSFDDEFGLFGDDVSTEEERRSTLGARKIATNETIIDEIEPEDEPRPRRRPSGGVPEGRGPAPSGRFFRRANTVKRDPLPVEIAHPRAVELLIFLSKKLVSNP